MSKPDLFRPLPNDKILDWWKLNTFADDKPIIVQKGDIWKHSGKCINPFLHDKILDQTKL